MGALPLGPACIAGQCGRPNFHFSLEAALSHSPVMAAVAAGKKHPIQPWEGPFKLLRCSFPLHLAR